MNGQTSPRVLICRKDAAGKRVFWCERCSLYSYLVYNTREAETVAYCCGLYMLHGTHGCG